MMILIVIGTTVAIAMGVCLVCAWMQMRRQEKIAEFTETLHDLPALKIAVRAGKRYHRPTCGHLRTHSIAG